MEAKRIQLVHKVEVLKMRQEKIATARQEQDAIKAEWTQLRAYRADLAEYAGRLQEELAQQGGELAALKGEWTKKTRTAAVGRTFDTFAGKDGRSFTQVVITRVTDVGVEFRHATGTARLAADQLAPEQQLAFALDTELAREAILQENALAADFASWVDQGVADAADREAARQQMLLAEYDEPAPAPSPTFTSTPDPAPSSSALREKARPFGNGGSIWSPYYRSYRTNYYYVPTPSCYSVPSSPRSSYTPSARSTPRNFTFTPR